MVILVSAPALLPRHQAQAPPCDLTAGVGRGLCQFEKEESGHPGSAALPSPWAGHEGGAHLLRGEGCAANPQGQGQDLRLHQPRPPGLGFPRCKEGLGRRWESTGQRISRCPWISGAAAHVALACPRPPPPAPLSRAAGGRAGSPSQAG